MTPSNVTTEAVPSTRASLAARFAEWLLRRERLEIARKRAPDPVAWAQANRVERARAVLTLADRTMAQAAIERPARAATTTRIALGLYRDAAFWAFAASSPVDPASDMAQAFDAAPADILRAAAGGDAQLDRARAALVNGHPHAEPPAYDEPAVAADIAIVAPFVHALIDALEVGTESVPRLVRERWTRIALVLAAAFAVVAGLNWLLPRVRPDLAASAPWRASSQSGEWAAAGVGFHPPEGGPNLFVHTAEQALPWVEFDLGSVRTVRYVYVQNRLDCCQERAVPLAVEVSQDQRTWTRVARQDEKFYYWSTTFTPVSARYVRFTTARTSSLHLGRVEIR